MTHEQLRAILSGPVGVAKRKGYPEPSTVTLHAGVIDALLAALEAKPATVKDSLTVDETIQARDTKIAMLQGALRFYQETADENNRIKVEDLATIQNLTTERSVLIDQLNNLGTKYFNLVEATAKQVLALRAERDAALTDAKQNTTRANLNLASLEKQIAWGNDAEARIADLESENTRLSVELSARRNA